MKRILMYCNIVVILPISKQVDIFMLLHPKQLNCRVQHLTT